MYNFEKITRRECKLRKLLSPRTRTRFDRHSIDNAPDEIPVHFALSGRAVHLRACVPLAVAPCICRRAPARARAVISGASLSRLSVIRIRSQTLRYFMMASYVITSRAFVRVLLFLRPYWISEGASSHSTFYFSSGLCFIALARLLTVTNRLEQTFNCLFTARKLRCLLVCAPVAQHRQKEAARSWKLQRVLRSFICISRGRCWCFVL